MTVPDFQTLMLPLLQLAADQQPHTTSEAIEAIVQHFNLSETDRKELLPSGRQTRLSNRVGWALTHLRKALILESQGRGRFAITARGLQVLQDKPEAINLRFLNQFPEHIDFRKKAEPQESDTTTTSPASDNLDSQTPEELLESSYQNLRQELATDLLERVKDGSPNFFEELVVDLLVAMGYGGSRKDAGQVTRAGADGGIDGVIKEDKLGLDVVYIQAKRWEGVVGRPVVQAFAGSLMGLSARKGVLITTSHFTREAIDYADTIQSPKIVLVDGVTLAQLMIDHNIGVSEIATYTLKRTDLDYFDG